MIEMANDYGQDNDNVVDDDDNPRPEINIMQASASADNDNGNGYSIDIDIDHNPQLQVEAKALKGSLSHDSPQLEGNDDNNITGFDLYSIAAIQQKQQKHVARSNSESIDHDAIIRAQFETGGDRSKSLFKKDLGDAMAVNNAVLDEVVGDIVTEGGGGDDGAVEANDNNDEDNDNDDDDDDVVVRDGALSAVTGMPGKVAGRAARPSSVASNAARGEGDHDYDGNRNGKENGHANQNDNDNEEDVAVNVNQLQNNDNHNDNDNDVDDDDATRGNQFKEDLNQAVAVEDAALDEIVGHMKTAGKKE